MTRKGGDTRDYQALYKPPHFIRSEKRSCGKYEELVMSSNGELISSKVGLRKCNTYSPLMAAPTSNVEQPIILAMAQKSWNSSYCDRGRVKIFHRAIKMTSNSSEAIEGFLSMTILAPRLHVLSVTISPRLI